MRFKNRMVLTAALLVAAATQGSQARAALVPIFPAAFPAGSPLVTFAGLADGTEINGLTVAGVTFRVTRAGLPQNGAVIIDGGPGVTNNIAPPTSSRSASRRGWPSMWSFQTR